MAPAYVHDTAVIAAVQGQDAGFRERLEPLADVKMAKMVRFLAAGLGVVLVGAACSRQ